jgi:hypothetical protein
MATVYVSLAVTVPPTATLAGTFVRVNAPCAFVVVVWFIIETVALAIGWSVTVSRSTPLTVPVGVKVFGLGFVTAVELVSPVQPNIASMETASIKYKNLFISLTSSW